MAFTDVVLSSLIGTGIGGLLVVGATLLTNRFNKAYTIKQRHLDDHKKNLQVLIRYLQEEMPNVNFRYNVSYDGFVYSPREPNLSRFDYSPSFHSAFYTEQSNGSPIFYRVDDYLYTDMSVHFPGLTEKLGNTERKMRSFGAKLSDQYYYLFLEVYRSLEETSESKFKTLYGKVNRQNSLSKNVDIFVQQNSGLGTALFNFVLNVPIGYWPNLYNAYKTSEGLLSDLELMAKEIGLKIPEVVSEIQILTDNIDSLYKDLLSSLEKQAHLNYLKGNCESVKIN